MASSQGYNYDAIQAVPAYRCPLCRGWFSDPDTTHTPVCPSCRVRAILYTCIRCGHEWCPQRPVPPRVCPACKSPYWNRPRIHGATRASPLPPGPSVDAPSPAPAPAPTTASPSPSPEASE